ncbi:MAG TPA: energy transducer TonB [Pyrinomonadaceae bacterium]
MKPRIFLLFAIYAFVMPLFASAQDRHVHSRYRKDSKTTVIETDWMYVINTAQQFMQFGLVARHPGERLEKTPEKVNLVLWSFSREVMYRQDKGPELNFDLDGESLTVRAQTYLVFKGQTKDGQDIFWSEKRPDLGQPSLLPVTAQVRDKAGINGLFMEQIIVELNPEQLLKLAAAKKVELQLGATKIPLTKDYLNTVREFNSSLVPGAQPVTAVKAEQPSPKAGEPIDVGVVNGRAISLPRPNYPSLAKGAGASGSVNVLVTIDETGKVTAARAISGHPLLREVSEAAAREARFKPPMISGKPVKVTGIIVYNFAP